MNIKEELSISAILIEDALNAYLACTDEETKTLWESVRYSALGGGKRIRPFITLEFCKLCGKSADYAIEFACAVELMHTASLIHDDMPCMDDDDLRRGKPTNHKTFGESTALLAGDALMIKTFELAASAKKLIEENRCDVVVSAIQEIGSSAGIDGMTGGQIMDLENVFKNTDFDRLKKTNLLKTGKMIILAAKLGCMAAGACKGDPRYEAAEVYAQSIGLAYQIVDDLLDYNHGHGETEESTYVSLLGIEKTKELAEQLTNQAIQALDVFGEGNEELKELALMLCNREI